MLASRGRWTLAPHLRLLNRKLVDIARGECNRLLVFMPPRHGKSEMISHYTPAWFVGAFPDKRVILASYEADFAASWGAKAREVLEEFGPPLFGVTPTGGRVRWGLEGLRGGMQTAGVGGPITGKGADLLIIDDPVKNDAEANSSTDREHKWEWFQSTAYTRLEPGGSVVLLMTRWHEDDLAGRLMANMQEGGEHWDVIEFPAVAEEHDALGRSPGEALWPMRYPTETLDQIRETVGSYWWNALYQQRPHELGGGVFKREWFRYWYEEPDAYVLSTKTGQKRVPKSVCWRFSTVDLAASVKESADYFVCGTFAVTPDNELLVLDVFRAHVEGPDQRGHLWNLYTLWQPGYIGIESVGYQLSLVQEMLRDGLPARPLRADKDKVSRSLTVAARYEAGLVFHKRSAPWLDDLEDELLTFPRGRHDDQVDVVAYAGIELAQGFAQVVSKPKGW